MCKCRKRKQEAKGDAVLWMRTLLMTIAVAVEPPEDSQRWAADSPSAAQRMGLNIAAKRNSQAGSG